MLIERSEWTGWKRKFVSAWKDKIWDVPRANGKICEEFWPEIFVSWRCRLGGTFGNDRRWGWKPTKSWEGVVWWWASDGMPKDGGGRVGVPIKKGHRGRILTVDEIWGNATFVRGKIWGCTPSKKLPNGGVGTGVCVPLEISEIWGCWESTDGEIWMKGCCMKGGTLKSKVSALGFSETQT